MRLKPKPPHSLGVIDAVLAKPSMRESNWLTDAAEGPHHSHHVCLSQALSTPPAQREPQVTHRFTLASGVPAVVDVSLQQVCRFRAAVGVER